MVNPGAPGLFCQWLYPAPIKPGVIQQMEPSEHTMTAKTALSFDLIGRLAFMLHLWCRQRSSFPSLQLLWTGRSICLIIIFICNFQSMPTE
jgi:hypothetical protein